MERLREAKSAKSMASPSPSTAVTPPEPATSAMPCTTSETPSRVTAGDHGPGMSAESLDESLRLPIVAQLSDDDSSDSDGDSGSFSSDDAQHVYQGWLQEQPKQNVKMMAVMIMDALVDRFNITTHGAANEIGLILGHNEKTVRTWRRDFYSNHGQFTGSRQGKHARLFILDDEGLRHKAAEWPMPPQREHPT